MHTEKVVARRYAKAFFDVACAHQELPAIVRDIETLENALRAEPALVTIDSFEEVSLSKRLQTVQDLATHFDLHVHTRNFLSLLLEKHRLQNLADVLHALQCLVAEQDGEVTAYVTTARPMLDGELLHAVQDAIGNLKQKKVRIVSQVDSTVIGGIVIRIGDEIFDGSLATELTRMRTHLLASGEE